MQVGLHLLYVLPGPSSEGSAGARLYSCCIHAMSSASPADRSRPVFWKRASAEHSPGI